MSGCRCRCQRCEDSIRLLHLTPALVAAAAAAALPANETLAVQTLDKGKSCSSYSRESESLLVMALNRSSPSSQPNLHRTQEASGQCVSHTQQCIRPLGSSHSAFVPLKCLVQKDGIPTCGGWTIN